LSSRSIHHWTLQDILAVHGKVCANEALGVRYGRNGTFRSGPFDQVCPVQHTFAPLSLEVPHLMAQMLSWAQSLTGCQHPVKVALDFLLNYDIIHPHPDCNFRTASILVHVILIQHGYPSFIHWHSTRSSAFKLFGETMIAAISGDRAPFYRFYSAQLVESSRLFSEILLHHFGLFCFVVLSLLC
jgi:Fic family protein